jgi:hypothetical protein
VARGQEEPEARALVPVKVEHIRRTGMRPPGSALPLTPPDSTSSNNLDDLPGA